MLIYDPSGNPVPLGEKLGGGGEAQIYNVTDKAQLAAKIYLNPKRYRESKLHAMISNPPADPTLHLGHPSICWPKSLLFNQAGICVGFIMHRVDLATHVPAFKLYHPMDRQSVSLNITWKYLIRTAANISAAVEAIHAQGHVIGDFNESNILVANNALVTLVDCDSMQVRDPVQGTCFRCTVGKPEFTPPELQGCEFSKTDRQTVHDNFGLAVMLFLLLMEGIHPFNGVWKRRGNPPPLENRIRNGLCPYAGNQEFGFMPAAPPLQLLPPLIVDLFVKCFREGHSDPSLRPHPSEWKTALTQLEESLIECSANSKHLYGNHLAACPWCERKKALGGVDPFPSEIQVIRPVAGAPLTGQMPLHADIRGNTSRLFLHSHLIKRTALLVVLIVVAVIGWHFLKTPVRQLWAALNINSILHPTPVITLSPMLICTGVDANGVPTGVSDRYTQDQLRETGVMAFLAFSGAVPQKTTFQMRWTIAGKTYESAVNVFQRESDSIRLDLGKDLPPGYHQIEFLVDGKVQRNASMTIESSSTEPARDAPKQKTRPPSPVQSAGVEKPVPVEVTSSPVSNAIESPPSAVIPSKTEEKVDRPVYVPANIIIYQAKHWHGFGSCSGEMRLTPRSIEFTSDQHTFKFAITDVQLDKDGIKDQSGRAWHFFIRETDSEKLLSRWKSGGLFGAAFRSETPSPPSTAEPQKSATRVFEAKHRHRFGSCSGELTLTVDAVEFSSKQHYVKSYLSTTQIDGNGILDRAGNGWQFEISGEDTGSLFRSWKNGTLFR